LNFHGKKLEHHAIFVAKLVMIILTSSQFLVPPSHEANYLLPPYSIRPHMEDHQMQPNETWNSG
jgi:hypothetical protein